MKDSLDSRRAALQDRILGNPITDFVALTLDVFRYQAVHNPVYASWIKLLGLQVSDISTLDQIPFMPVELFKTYTVQTGTWTPEAIFSSSGTTGQLTGRHCLRSTAWYKAIAKQIFADFYGPVQDYCILALLPAYLERTGSSLVFMADDFIHESNTPLSGFYLYDMEALAKVLQTCQAQKKPTLLLGVSFALLDLAEAHPMELSDIIVMETGGMKGRRKELTRAQLHETLMEAFSLPAVHSEYGMTELLSQAYAKANGMFYPGYTMRVIIKDTTDPRCTRQTGQNGLINIIDLANLDTLSFLATQDIGKLHPDGAFEVLGRLDQSEIRGCNLMVE